MKSAHHAKAVAVMKTIILMNIPKKSFRTIFVSADIFRKLFSDSTVKKINL